MPRSICQSAAATLELVTDGLQPGERVEIRDPSGLHLTLHVERLADISNGSCFIVAHRHAGCVPVPDPEVALVRATDGYWTPLAITLPLSQLVTVGTDGVVVAGRRDEHRRLVMLVEVWMRNIHTNLLRLSLPENQDIEAPVAYPAG